jgi:hypothetical protein
MLLAVVDTSSTAYQLGRVAGMAVVALIAYAVARHALTRGFVKPAPVTAAPVADSAPAWPGQPRAFVPAAPRVHVPSGLDKAIALAAVVAAGVVLVAGANSLLAEHASGPWAKSPGVEIKAGFEDGCSASGTARSTCQCVFSRITSVPPYDTPSGFATLQNGLQTFARTGSVTDIPPVMIAAVRGCRG